MAAAAAMMAAAAAAAAIAPSFALCAAERRPNVVNDFDMSEAALQKLVAENPVAATLVFQATMENVVKHIINIHPARKTNHLICGSDEGIKDAHKP